MYSTLNYANNIIWTITTLCNEPIWIFLVCSVIVMRIISWEVTLRTNDFIAVCGHTVKCLKYDVQSQPVSIHLPLSRYLAGNLLLCFHVKVSSFPLIIIIINFDYLYTECSIINTAVSWFSTLPFFFLGLHVYMGDYNLQFGCPELNVQVKRKKLRMNCSQKIPLYDW